MRSGAAGARLEAPSMAQEVLESTLKGAVVVRLCRCLEDCAAAPNSPGHTPAWSDRCLACLSASLLFSCEVGILKGPARITLSWREDVSAVV